jgi:ferrous iron transport protein B
MNEAVVHLHPPGRLAALVGNPNAGKTALFNRLTGSRQKVANYAGVTIERKEGRLTLASGKTVRVLDLPGTYSLHPRSPDERITCQVLQGNAAGEKRPDLVVCVVDATNLRRGLRLVLGVQRMGLPCVVALNMADLAASRGMHVDPEALARELGVPVVSTVAVRSDGDAPLRALLEQPEIWQRLPSAGAIVPPPQDEQPDHQRVRVILGRLGLDAAVPHLLSDRIDRVVLHPVLGPLLLAVLLFLMFQAVFAWAEAPKAWIEAATQWAGAQVGSFLPEGYLRSFVADGLIAGLGGVVVFLPQILILFFFILVLEESGYLPRAAFLLDRLMGSVGLSGRSFIPLLSSFACAIPGIMATRTIANPRDRLVTIMIAPLMTCSARLPVYALLIGSFIPQRTVGPGFELQGLVLFGLYVSGIAGSMGVAWALKRTTTHGQVRALMMELPTYHWPHVRNVALGLWQRTVIFLRRVGGIILVLTMALWLLASFPAPPPGATGAAIEYSLAGMLGHGLAVLLGPVGFNWQISIALVPGLAAREVVVSALGTVYALSASGKADAAQTLAPLIAHSWSLATGLSLMAWFVFAPQCMATLATVKRETGGWKWPLVMAGYLFALAYAASFATYRIALLLGWG